MKKKLLCVLLATFMLFSLMTGCNGDSEGGNRGTRTIRIGTWYSMYYTSQHDDIYANRNISNTENAAMELENMRRIEQEFDVRLNYVNMTWDGIQESIITSILAGRPDADVYLTNLQFGIPAVLGDMAIAIDSVEIGADASILNNTSNVMKSLQLTGQEGTYLFASAGFGGDQLPIYALGFNWDMLQRANLENPQDLWERGEWTWNVWVDYLERLTDRQADIFGWSGYWTYLLTGLLMSNGAAVADRPQTRVTESATIEVFELYDRIYNVLNVARPWEPGDGSGAAWVLNNNLYAEGKSAFWITADWLMIEQGGSELPFCIGVVPWPTGPNIARNPELGDSLGRQLTFGAVSGAYYMIPLGTQDPKLVFDVMYEWFHWFGEDDWRTGELEYSRNAYETMRDYPGRNFEIARMMAENTGFEIWASLGLADEFNMLQIIMPENGQQPGPYAHAIAPVIQNRLDEFFD